MKNNASTLKTYRRNVALTLGLFLFSIYLFTYRGGFHSIDEVSIFAVTESLVKFGQFNTDQIAWTQWTTTQAEAQGFFGQNGHVYSKKGIALSLAQAPLYWLALLLPNVGMLQTVSLLNAFITAATSLLVFMFVHRLRFSRFTAVFVGLLLGGFTIMSVYAKYLFSEPLAGFLLLLAAYMLFAYRQEGGLRHIVIAGFAAGFAVLTRANNLFLLPVFGLYLLWIEYQQLKDSTWSLSSFVIRPLVYSAGSFILSVAIPGLILLGYNAIRSGNPLQTGYDLTLFSPNVLTGFYKLLFSPLRGLFVYSPILLLSIPGWWYVRRTHTAEAWLFLGLTGITIGLFSAWSSGEGLSWGSRFLVPVVPFFAICLAPIVEKVMSGKWHVESGRSQIASHKSTSSSQPKIQNPKSVLSEVEVSKIQNLNLFRITFYALLIISLFIQILGVTINPWIFLARMQADFGGEFFLERTAALYDFRYSQIVGQFQAWSVENSDLAWWQPWGFDVVAFSLSLMLVIFTGWLLLRQLKTSSFIIHHSSLIITSTIITLAITYFLLTRYYQTDLQFGPPDDSYTQALDTITSQSSGDEQIITVAQHHYHVPMNRYKGRESIIGFAQQVEPLPQTALPLLSASVAQSNIWLVTIGFAPAAADNAIEAWLARNTYKISDTWLPDEVRLIQFGTQEPDINRPIGIMLNDEIELASANLVDDLRAGQTLPIELIWQARTSPQADYNTFVQLIDINGQLVAQHDSPPNGGYSPTAGWKTNQTITSRHALALSVNLPSGDYRLIVGLYNAATGQRLLAENGADSIELGNVTVNPVKQ